MRNKTFIFTFLFCFFLFNFSYSKIVKFETPKIEIKDDGKKITAKNGVIVESDDGIIINADEAIYDKESNILKFINNIKVKDNFNSINFTSDEIVYEQARYYLHTLECFGPERCMFESNFPVERQSCSYTALWNQFKKLSGSFSSTERTAMMHDTAMRVYRLDAV